MDDIKKVISNRNVNTRDEEGKSPLHWAAQNGNFKYLFYISNIIFAMFDKHKYCL